METHEAPFGQFLHTAITGESAATHYYGEPFFHWIAKSPELVGVQNAAMATFAQGLRASMFDNYALSWGKPLHHGEHPVLLPCSHHSAGTMPAE
jgi:hypothetical protein